MERIINIDISNKADLVDKYNKRVVSNDLINYIINKALVCSKKDEIKLLINNECKLDGDYISLIREGLDLEYKKSLKRHHINNIKEFFLVVIGIIFLFISRIVGESVFSEVFLIIGWVPVWEAIELELFSDNEERRRRVFLKKLLDSDIVVNE